MAMQNLHLLPFATIIVSSLLFSCCDSNENILKHEYGYDPEAYPLPFDPIQDGEFKNLIKRRTDDVLSFKSSEKPSGSDQKIVTVSDFGAKGDGENDDTEAFVKAWKKACSSYKATLLLVPEGNKYLLKPIRFSGPCKADITFQVYGNLEASKDQSHYREDSRHWLRFDRVDNLLVEGGESGIVDGNGKIWWQNSCKVNKTNPCKDAPTALTFYKCKNLRANDLKIINAQQIQVSFDKCKNVEASNLEIAAPEDSPNTDGIHITGTENIQITSSVIGTGDDCISIVSGSKNVQVQDITCGPGHGISIGSLGKGKSKAYVSGIIVDGAMLTGTQNGVRIKTWQGGSGNANNIRFQNIQMDNVKNPIIIDQNYCDQDEPCKQQKSAVQVKNVVYQNIKGTSASDVAIRFDCSKNHPCQNIVLQNVELEGGIASCKNAKVTEQGTVSPSCGSRD